MAVTLTQLSAFLTVVRRGSVTAAAEELFVTQPSVSAAIAALEREVGVKLAERDGRGLRPTDAGAAFAPYAAHVLGLLEQGERAAREAAEGGQASLRISAVTAAGDHVVPQLIRVFRDAHPELDLSLHIGNRSEVFSGLLDHRSDVAITGRVPDDERLVGERQLGQRLLGQRVVGLGVVGLGRLGQRGLGQRGLGQRPVGLLARRRRHERRVLGHS
jgi:DNA-binding transcriptional LysR family regulator